jgi:hypothetical protein
MVCRNRDAFFKNEPPQPPLPPTPPPPSPQPGTIGFRLEKEYREVLAKRAECMNRSIHDLAKSYVQEMLHQGEEREDLREALVMMSENHLRLQEQIIELQKAFIKIRNQLVVGIEGILVSVGHEDPEDAHNWIVSNFK